MAHPTDWDVEQYRNDHEPPEHWHLCRAFIETHKADYPEASLVYLSQCFANMELLGCQYPEEVMQLVRRLSAGIAEDYRLEKQKIEAKEALKRVAHDRDGGTSAKSHRPCKGKPSGNSAAFILVEHGDTRDDNPLNRLQCSSDFCKVRFKLKFIGSVCECRVGGDLVGTSKRPDGSYGISAKDVGAKTAKMAAAAEALEVLRRRCYTIRIKNTTLSEDVTRGELVADEGEAEAAQKLTDGVGGKLLAMMGWTGGGLGKQRQGITEPVRVDAVFGRKGLGSEKRTVARHKEFGTKAELRLRAYASEFQERDLSFSKEFTDKEHKEIHTLANRFGLKCKSHGKGDDQYLVVSHRFQPHQLLQYLIAIGGETEKYKVIPPQLGKNTATEEGGSPGRCEMSAGVADDCRLENQEIQRTSARASDAAEAKVTRKRIAYDTDGGTSAKSYRLCEEKPAGNSTAFILVEYGDERDDNPVNRLRCSSGFCKVAVRLDFKGDACECRVGGDLLGTGKRPGGSDAVTVKHRTKRVRNKAAMMEAATEALEVLRRRCYTVRLKFNILSDEGVTRGERVASEEEAAQKLGGKLLAMMGLTGSGQGKEGLGTVGILEPVRLDEVVGQQALGSEKRTVTQEFMEKIELRLRAYASKFQGHDLSFGNEFTDEEQKEIRTLADRFGLRYKSQGKGAGRFLVVSYESYPHHLLQYLIAAGGETDKYELIPPQTEEAQRAENTAVEERSSPCRHEMSMDIAEDHLLEKLATQKSSMCAAAATEAKAAQKRIADATDGGTSATSYMICKKPAGNSAAFILVEDDHTRADGHPVSRLKRASHACKVPVSLGFKGNICECRVGGELLGTGIRPDGPNDKEKRRNAPAKMAAATEALEVLRRRCYTIRIKSKILSDKDVARGELVACEGFKEFKEKAELRLRAYASECQEHDLSFSNEFTYEERKEIHTLAEHFGLKSKSYDKGDGRFLVVSHKFEPHHVLQYLIAAGGETDKYELISPQTEEMNSM